MPWFVAKPFSGSWGWHWTMNHFNPDIVDGNGQREIASWYYPEIGPYDSDDDAVLEYQVTLMKLAGIDGVIVDWYGMDNYADYAVNNQRTLALFNWTRKAGLQFALCYEDQTIRAEVAAKFIATNQAVAHAQQTMLYAQSNFFNDPSYARLGGQPVLLNFGPQYFTTSANWSSIFSVLSGSNATPAFFTEDNRLGLWKGAFEWPPMWMAATNAGVLNATQLDEYLTAFEQKARAVPPWPAYISSAFPRFHDIYAQAGVSASYGILDDASGATFQNTLRRAFTNTSSLVQLVTWNDYGEGTIIEPTAQFG
ncbi:MAG TPA: glycoside hydrolase family 71/99-like protein, partial [Verrucomicrobiae bacterium]|nr:glycoside hydrolase family 71/99-like protein [Verrucomicrobiae bacterium]